MQVDEELAAERGRPAGDAALRRPERQVDGLLGSDIEGMGLAAVVAAVEITGHDDHLRRLVPVDVVVGVGYGQREEARRVAADPDVEVDLVEALQRARLLCVLGQLARGQHGGVAGRRRRAAAVDDLGNRCAVGQGGRCVRRQREAPVAQITAVGLAGGGEGDRKARITVNAIAGGRVVQSVTPHRQARRRIGRIAREALRGAAVRAQEVVRVVGEVERARGPAVRAQDISGAAVGSVRRELERGGAWPTAAAMRRLVLEVGQRAVRLALDIALHHARLCRVAVAAEVEAEDAVGIGGAGCLGSADIDENEALLRVAGVFEPDLDAHRVGIGCACRIDHGAHVVRGLRRAAAGTGVRGAGLGALVTLVLVGVGDVGGFVHELVGSRGMQIAHDHVDRADALRRGVFDVRTLRVGVVGRGRRRRGVRPGKGQPGGGDQAQGFEWRHGQSPASRHSWR